MITYVLLPCWTKRIVRVDFTNDCLSRGITEKDLVNAYGEYFKNKR